MQARIIANAGRFDPGQCHTGRQTWSHLWSQGCSEIFPALPVPTQPLDQQFRGTAVLHTSQGFRDRGTAVWAMRVVMVMVFTVMAWRAKREGGGWEEDAGWTAEVAQTASCAFPFLSAPGKSPSRPGMQLRCFDNRGIKVGP